ncbi:hypothetical protein [Candidatus Berkiella aquae]|uniref:Protein kinase domain-containing protein n=1 Tax=Candidatus Berkiella aquae TaxID=295108 RepID=A0A0Q9YZN5_9GAMM|nr:hypothetical protein [Candidatus Berkiella aquae]MCS5711595.1 hypothetical protein [Candidatus Berkiella aquae]
MLTFIDLLPTPLRAIQVGDEVLTFCNFLHRGSGGLTSLYLDQAQNKYVLKSTLGDDASLEAELNERLGRMRRYIKGDDDHDHLLLTYIDGEDVEKALAKHLASPPIDEIGCALFEPAYLENPYLGFKNGLERNLTIAIELVKEQEALYLNNIIHNDVQLANYILTETQGNIKISGIDFGTATDLIKVGSSIKNRQILKENIISLQEALKAILPQRNYQRMISALSKKRTIKHEDIVEALQAQLEPKLTEKQIGLPSFIHALQSMEQSIKSELSTEAMKVNPRHIAFIESRLERSIRQNNVNDTVCYILHGGKLTDRMVEQLTRNPESDLTKLLAPYIQEHELQKLEVGIERLTLSKSRGK